MKQKYLILKDDEKKVLIIKEFAELDKETFYLLCEETYPNKDIQSAIKEGQKALLGTLRTPSMYPIRKYALQIAQEVIDLYQSKEADSKELFLTMQIFWYKTVRIPKPLDEDKNDLVELDDLLDDDTKDSTYDDEIKNITQPIQIADDDGADMVDED